MKHLFRLLLACLLLTGCTSEAPPPETAPPVTQPQTVSTQPPVSLYLPGSALEQSTQGALRVYPLNRTDATGLLATQQGLLVFSGTETADLMLLQGEDLSVTASRSLNCPLSPEDPSIRLHSGGLSYFDSARRQTVLLDNLLKEVSHIPAPEDLVGTPLLSRDQNTLFYCTAQALLAWDLESGLHRQVKQFSYSEQTVTNLHQNDGLIECQIRDGASIRTLLLSAENGQLIRETEGTLDLHIQSDTCFAAFPTGMTQALLFGPLDSQPTALTPADLTAAYHYLEESSAVLTAGLSGGTVRLDHYDLASGQRSASVTLALSSLPASAADTGSGFVYILTQDPAYGGSTICRWDVRSGTLSDTTVYTGPYYTAKSPDREGLAQCQAYAADISARHGVEVLIWEDAAAREPWDYDLEPEYLVPVLQRELELLDQRLSRYPEGFLAKTAEPFSGLTFCIVRQLTGTAESGSLNTATGVQFFEGNHAYVILAAGNYSEQALYHELFHVMETQLLTKSTAFDRWEELNPSGFSYDYDYAANAIRDAGIYLQEETRAFIDTYSMSFPKEDRARVMEYAMLSGADSLFRSDTLQAKLRTLCKGIREAYGLRKSPEVFPWEQYLTDPLAYQG